MKSTIIALAIFFNLSAYSQTVTWTIEKVDSSCITIKKDCPRKKIVQYRKTIKVRNTSPVDIGYTHRLETFTVTVNIRNGVQTYSVSNHTYSYQVKPQAITTLTAANNFTETISPSGLYPVFIQAAITSTLASITHTALVSGAERRTVFEKYLYLSRIHPGILYVSPFVLVARSDRAVYVNTQTYNNNAFLNRTAYNESALNTASFGLKLGCRIYKHHIFYAEVMQLTQGFEVLYDSISPFNGLPDVALVRNSYNYSSNVVGVGYSYNPYHPNSHLNFTCELGPYYSLTSDFDKTSHLNPNRFGFKAAAGVSIKPNFRWDIKIQPTLMYDFTSLHTADIKTRLYNYGLTFSVGFSLFNIKKVC